MTPFDRLLLPENLHYAWLKAKSLYRRADGFVDLGELAAFELDLERRLLDIHRQFDRGSYRLKKLRPLPRPKKICDDLPVDRQYYHVALEDQVAWIALVNALGPELDKRMPPWSYGNRLYRPAWYENGKEAQSTLEIGPYRHASGHLYRKFQHSWPLFRRQVALTARTMVARRQLRSDEMDETDRLAAASAEREDLPYTSLGFWPSKSGKDAGTELYHASIDLKQFYPTLKTEAVIKGLAVAGATEDPRITKLLIDMMRFQLDIGKMSQATLKNVEPPFLKRSVRGIPTGLFVAGFLANSAMLPVDLEVSNRLDQLRSVAHFRFVDDHTVIAYDFDTLCDWIAWYEQLLEAHGIGAVVNNEKYDPPSLSKWMALRKRDASTVSVPTGKARLRHDAIRSEAVRDTRLDGNNPTKLMTKTLAQVSAIAATNIHILDDEDLEERLKMLEWLLLADIPEREIRPDTRAAFAAGQIASLATVLVQEADGLVEASRLLAQLKTRNPDPKRTTAEERASYAASLRKLSKEYEECEEKHRKVETDLLAHCFTLLLQSLREHPGKARLVYRIHQYCRVTGYAGLGQVADWLKEMRATRKDVWADYYAGLSLQIMASGILAAVRRIDDNDALRSDVNAAMRHLDDVGRLDPAAFLLPRSREAWFHATGRKEFGVALLAAAKQLAVHTENSPLAARLTELGSQCIAVAPGMSAAAWEAETGRSSGVWAHFIETALGCDTTPSATWHALTEYFEFTNRLDAQAARRYPEWLPETGWKQLLRMPESLPESDSGWLCEVIGTDVQRRAEAQASGKVAISRAARSLELPSMASITLNQWTQEITACSPFDPRRSEWTALEISRQLVERVVAFDGSESLLDRLHPNNVLLPREWISRFTCNSERSEVSWEEWRRFVQSPETGQAKLRDPAASIVDYRYATDSRVGLPLDEWERRLSAVGRLLLGLLRNDFSAPRLWNLRGNEKIVRLPRAQWFEALAISSPTFLLIESCLGARTAETRSINRIPSLFAWLDGERVNDAGFDPPLLVGTTALLKAIHNAQRVLEENQLAVMMNQPRQMIPFRLSDFAVGDEDDGDNDAE